MLPASLLPGCRVKPSDSIRILELQWRLCMNLCMTFFYFFLYTWVNSAAGQSSDSLSTWRALHALWMLDWIYIQEPVFTDLNTHTHTHVLFQQQMTNVMLLRSYACVGHAWVKDQAQYYYSNSKYIVRGKWKLWRGKREMAESAELNLWHQFD